MTASERESAKKMLARKQVGWAYMADERKAMLRSTVTKDAVLAFQSSFEYAQKLPPRLDCGLVEFYAVLARGRRQVVDLIRAAAALQAKLDQFDRLRLCSAEDLVIMKAFAGRDRDWDDIRGVLERQSELDWQYIESGFTPLLELAEKPDRMDRLLAMRNS